jgi:hypothetical protein
MAKLTRRGFLEKTSVGAAAVGALITVPGLTKVPNAKAAPAPTSSDAVIDLSAAERSGLLVAHVRNLKTGEIALMVGTREIVFHDRRFVARLVKAAR